MTDTPKTSDYLLRPSTPLTGTTRHHTYFVSCITRHSVQSPTRHLSVLNSCPSAYRARRVNLISRFPCLFSKFPSPASRIPRIPAQFCLVFFENTFLLTYLGAFASSLPFGDWLLGLGAVGIEHVEVSYLTLISISRSGNCLPLLYQEARTIANQWETERINPQPSRER